MEWMKRNAVELNSEIIKVLQSPGVYAYAQGDRVLYVGKAKSLGERAFRTTHQFRKEFEKKATSLILFPCENETQAFLLETEIIHALQPVLNMRGKLFTQDNARAAKVRDVVALHEKYQGLESRLPAVMM